MDQAKNTLIGLVAFLALFGGLLWYANPGANSNGSADGAQSPQSTSSAALTAREISYDFGTISMAAGKVSRAFEVTNEGPESIKIGKVYTSCMCTEAVIHDASGRDYGPFGMPGHGGGAGPFANIEVPAGGSITVEAVFDPAAHGPSGVGLAQRSVYLETNSKSTPKVELTFQAMVAR